MAWGLHCGDSGGVLPEVDPKQAEEVMEHRVWHLREHRENVLTETHRTPPHTYRHRRPFTNPPTAPHTYTHTNTHMNTHTHTDMQTQTNWHRRRRIVAKKGEKKARKGKERKKT